MRPDLIPTTLLLTVLTGLSASAASPIRAAPPPPQLPAVGGGRLLPPPPPTDDPELQPASRIRQVAGEKDVEPAEEDEPRHPDLQVLLIMSWSYPGAEAKLRELEQVDGAFERLRKKGWKVGVRPEDHLRIVSVDQVRALVESQGIRTFPAVLAAHEGQVIRSFTSGCTTPLDEHTFEWLRTGTGSRPAEAPRPAPTVVTTGRYPLRGGHWSVDGDWYPSIERLLQHLRGPNHRHLIPANWEIETWSIEELRSLHDDLHETGHPRSLQTSDEPQFAERSRTGGSRTGEFSYGATSSSRSSGYSTWSRSYGRSTSSSEAAPTHRSGGGLLKFVP